MTVTVTATHLQGYTVTVATMPANLTEPQGLLVLRPPRAGACHGPVELLLVRLAAASGPGGGGYRR